MPATVTANLTLVNAAESTTGWLSSGLTTALSTVDDLRIQGSFALQARVSSTTGWIAAPVLSPAVNFSTGEDHIFWWYKSTTPPSDDTKANGGRVIWISSNSAITITGTSPNNGPTNSKNWRVDGNDTEKYGPWICYVVDPRGTADFTLGIPNLSAIQLLGCRKKTISAVATSTRDIIVDVVRYGTGLTINDGTAAAPATFADIFSADSDISNAYGVINQSDGIFYLSGKLRFGTTGQTAITYFKDTNQVVVYNNFPVADTFYEIIVVGNATFPTTFQLGNFSGGVASGGVTIRGAPKVSGDTNPSVKPFAVWTLTASDANAVVKLYGSTFSQMRRATFNSTADIRSCTFSNFGNITANGATFDKCTFVDLVTTSPISGTYGIDATGSTPATITNCNFVNVATALKWTNSNALNGKINGTSFISGGTGHAIELVGTAANQTLTNVTFSGYAATDGNTGNEAIFVNIPSGSMTISIVGGNTPSIRTAGATVTVQNAVTVKLTAKDANTLSPISGARVLMEADTGGPLPSGASVSITSSGTTATVTHTAHGLKTGQQVVIRGANEDNYNGIFTITVVNANTYTYTMPGAAPSPATGTPNSTAVIISDVTDSNGVVQTSFNFTSNQPVKGRVRKATPPGTLYKTGAITGTITSAGLDTTVLLIPDV